MKQRITYLLPPGTDYDPANIHISPDSVNITDTAEAPAIEKRVTAGLSELPAELRHVLSSIHELHIRYTSRQPYLAPSPLTSRLPPGLHVFFTPLASAPETDICPLLKSLFASPTQNIKCPSTPQSFSPIPILPGSERFAHTSSHQYYTPLPKNQILAFQTFLSRTFCPGTFRGECPNEIATLSFASYIDIDFDAISHAVTLTAVWRAGIGNPAARTPAKLWGGQDGGGLEVGVLVPQTADEAEEIKLGGFLTVVGEDEYPSATMFSFPSRHHAVPQSSLDIEPSFGISFQQPTGLHPKMSITFPQHQEGEKQQEGREGFLSPPKSEGACALHAYLTLPSAVFLDRYQLSDPAVLRENGLVALRSSSGEQDLEAPEWVVERWGSAALLELSPPPPNDSADDRGEWEVSVPLHLRYLQAANMTGGSEGGRGGGEGGEGYVDLTISFPAVFWACEAEEGLKMSTNPFDRVDIGYDGLFGPRTMFYHFSPATGGSSAGGSSAGGPGVGGGGMGSGIGQGVLESVIRVPVLEPVWGGLVAWGTFGAVVGGFGWVVWGLVRGMGRGKKGGVVKKTE
ncbi:protease B nonderepressible form [Elasticomyces elasticus]|nr:protease B nonderepressible form [Elasticomyces elasticus]KAK3659663.1 protease B nonderepressible form [Elasticomyces elasticus]KAK4916886.1 protease B nonderepressible form [Elasticomyces elasticus]KAK5747607.1 protease B nonderepressible form [Elasticomyces elasticus]